MRSIQVPYALFLVALVVGGCTEQEAPTAYDPVPLAPDFAVAGQSDCYTVLFKVRLSPTGVRRQAGTATGDLEGAVSVQFDDPPFDFAGITVRNTGSADFAITGGIVPAPFAFSTSFHNMNHLIDRPGSPATLFENIGRHRATSGVAMANLTYRGTFSAVPLPQTDHDYRGVICM